VYNILCRPETLTIDEDEALVTILVIDKRNDNAIYRTLRRRFG
jgi:hypothetical protein